jgi:hypothetical protein
MTCGRATERTRGERVQSNLKPIHNDAAPQDCVMLPYISSSHRQRRCAGASNETGNQRGEVHFVVHPASAEKKNLARRRIDTTDE